MLTLIILCRTYVKLDWDDLGDTSITHCKVLRRDVGTHENGHFIVIDSDTGSAQVQYLDHAVENDRRYVYRIGVNIEGSNSEFPDGPTSVSVTVHANSSGQPGAPLPLLLAG